MILFSQGEVIGTTIRFILLSETTITKDKIDEKGKALETVSIRK